MNLPEHNTATSSGSKVKREPRIADIHADHSILAEDVPWRFSAFLAAHLIKLLLFNYPRTLLGCDEVSGKF